MSGHDRSLSREEQELAPTTLAIRRADEDGADTTSDISLQNRSGTIDPLEHHLKREYTSNSRIPDEKGMEEAVSAEGEHKSETISSEVEKGVQDNDLEDRPRATLGKTGKESAAQNVHDVPKTLHDGEWTHMHSLQSGLDNSGFGAGSPLAEQPLSSESGSGKPRGEDSDIEFKNILEQFNYQTHNSDGLELPLAESTPLDSSPFAVQAQHPPRTSSLEPTRAAVTTPNDNAPLSGSEKAASSINDPTAPHTFDHGRLRRVSFPPEDHSEVYSPKSPLSSPSLHKALPPAPEPEPDLPFDFHRFLDQLRHRTADPVAKFLRSFLTEFGKKQWMVHEQVKIISDFLAFITGKMAQCEVWRGVSDAEFDNAREGMEKLVMNRLYSQTFSPAIPAPASSLSLKEKKKAVERQTQPYRRGQHQEDIERDEVLAQKVRIYKWIREEHLDIPAVGESGKRFLFLAQQELSKIKSYRAPRDKVICILNCCKVIFGLLRNSKASDTSADAFMPLLIYVILQANPEHLVSNAQYILRFRNQDKLAGEAGYYVSSLMGAIQFIENLDRTSITVSDEDFEKNVEAAVSDIAERETIHHEPISERHQSDSETEKPDSARLSRHTFKQSEAAKHQDMEASEKDAMNDGGEERAAVSGLLRSIQRPLSNIGRIFSEESSQFPANLKPQQGSGAPPETPRRLSPALFQPPKDRRDEGAASNANQSSRSPRLTAEDAAARQASAETAEAQRIQRAEHEDVVETLAGMFPNLDKDVIDDVVRLKEGRIGSAVDACLALNTDA